MEGTTIKTLVRDNIYHFMLSFCKLISDFEFNVKGKENLPRQSIIASNHWGSFDPIPISFGLERKIITITKRPGKLLRPPGFIPYLGRISLSDGIKNSMESAIDYYRRGYSILTFPGGEGRKECADGEIRNIYPYVLLLSKITNLPITPIGIKGLKENWSEPNLLPHLKSSFNICIGKPMSPSESKKDYGLLSYRLKEEIERLYKEANKSY